jgi:indole-3-glycerol phosphate synthase
VAEVERAPRRFRGFHAALADEARDSFPLICEVKRASPSVGAIRAGADAPARARRYAEAGARCVSVLTEGRRFGGSLDDLRQVRAEVEVPLLRKDFIVDPYMIAEAVEAGADCILLIVAAVSPALLGELWACARSLGIDVLLELIYERDLEALADIETPLVGVNARDLETLEVDAARFTALGPAVTNAGRLLVAESGIRTPDDLRALKAQGAKAALIGEALMRAEDPAAAVGALAAVGRE